jgi:hypothetical protein
MLKIVQFAKLVSQVGEVGGGVEGTAGYTFHELFGKIPGAVAVNIIS